MKTHKITIGHHIENAWTIILYLSGSIIYPIYMINRFGPDDKIFFIECSIGFFLLFFIPQFLLHLNYYFVNKGDTFSYDQSDWKMTYTHKGYSKTYKINNVTSIEQHRSWPFAENRMQWFSWDCYNYSIIRFEDGNYFVVTSLLVPKLELKVDNEKIKLKKKFYCWSPSQPKF